MVDLDGTDELADWCKSVENVALQMGIAIESFTIERWAEVEAIPVQELLALPYVERWLRERGEWDEYLRKYGRG